MESHNGTGNVLHHTSVITSHNYFDLRAGITLHEINWVSHIEPPMDALSYHGILFI
jgi:hypothetical protein